MSPRPPGAAALSPVDLAPLVGRLVKVRTLTRDGRAEADTLTGWLVSVRSDRLELALHVGALRWVRLPRVLAVEPYTAADLSREARGAVDLLRQSLGEHRNSQAPNDNPASGSPLVKKAQPGADAGRGVTMTNQTETPTEKQRRLLLDDLERKWHHYCAHHQGPVPASMPAGVIDRMGEEFHAAIKAKNLDGARSVFSRFTDMMEGRV